MARSIRGHTIKSDSVMLTQPKTLLPFTVLGGFLGAGKTTLLNRLLTETQDTRFAVLVNDFGELNIDEGLVARHDGKTISLSNGCMCCSMADGFLSTLMTVMDRADEFDHVVVEASGVANPRRIMDIATLDPGLMPNGSIVLVDCPQFLSQLEDPLINDAVITQLVEADIIVLNKFALTDAATITRVHRRIDQLNPGCPRVINDGENLQPTLLLGGDHRLDASTAGSTPRFASVVPGPSHDHGDLRFRSVVLRQTEPIHREDFNRWVEALPPSIIRGKGFIALAESPGEAWLWQKVGRSTVLARYSAVEEIALALVLIGTSAMSGYDDPSLTGLFVKT